jgi:hypothetical protein
MYIDMFLFLYHGLWCPFYSQGGFCQFSLFGSIICLGYFHYLFLLTLLYDHTHTSVPCVILPLVFWAHKLSCRFKYCSFANIGHAIIMWSILTSNSWQSLHLLFPFLIFSMHDIWFIRFDLVLLLFHSQFQLSDHSSIAIGTCLLH